MLRSVRAVIDTRLIAFLIVMAAVSHITSSCTHPPPNLSPSGVAAFHKTEIVKQLDILRDTVIQANELNPPLVSTDVTRKVVLAHKSILVTIQASEVGWQATVAASLDGIVVNLPQEQAKVILPYVALIKAILQEIP